MSHRTPLVLRFALAVLILLSTPLQAVAKEAAAYRLGIFPYMAPRQTVQFFGPVAASMTEALQHPVKLESVPTFGDFKRAMAAKSYDVALVQPFDYPEMVDKLGYIPLAQLAVPLVSQFYVRDDSRYQKLEDLRGTTVAMPPAEAANARMTLRALHDNGLVPGRDVEVRHFNSHDSCIQQVWAGSASACGTAKPPIAVFEQRMQARLRAIYDTPPVPHIVFVAHPRVPAAERAKLQERIIGWSQSEDGRALLKNLGFPGFVTPKPTEYAMMRNYDPADGIAKDATAPDAGKGLIFGVFPYFAPRQLAQIYAPALPALSKAAGVPVHLRTASTFANFGSGVAATSYDIVVLQPFDYAKAEKHGYLPLAGMKEKLQGTFFVRQDSPYKTIADFKGKVVAMPPAEAAQSRLGRHALAQAGLQPGRDVTVDYRNNHSSCLQQVQQGAVAACVTTEIALAMLPGELSAGLRSVGQTEKIPGVLFMAHKRMPAKMRDQVQADILAWKDSDAGREILLSLGLGELVKADSADYRRMPRLEERR